jgi:hypothetical protein
LQQVSVSGDQRRVRGARALFRIQRGGTRVFAVLLLLLSGGGAVIGISP